MIAKHVTCFAPRFQHIFIARMLLEISAIYEPIDRRYTSFMQGSNNLGRDLNAALAGR